MKTTCDTNIFIKSLFDAEYAYNTFMFLKSRDSFYPLLLYNEISNNSLELLSYFHRLNQKLKDSKIGIEKELKNEYYSKLIKKYPNVYDEMMKIKNLKEIDHLITKLTNISSYSLPILKYPEKDKEVQPILKKPGNVKNMGLLKIKIKDERDIKILILSNEYGDFLKEDINFITDNFEHINKFKDLIEKTLNFLHIYSNSEWFKNAS
ncbi:MAG: hypothetical protein KAT77_04950 [Nanoarchaeota archaeon]|nr:hypothetical protein [Nanoarchaeota archaeon]